MIPLFSSIIWIIRIDCKVTTVNITNGISFFCYRFCSYRFQLSATRVKLNNLIDCVSWNCFPIRELINSSSDRSWRECIRWVFSYY